MAPSSANVPTPVPFPQPEEIQPPQKPSSSDPNSPTTARRSRTSTNASATSASSRIRTASIKFMEATPPPGMWAATGSVASKAPTLAEIRRGSFGSQGWSEESQRYKAERRASTTSTSAAPESPIRPTVNNARSSSNNLKATGVEPFPAVTEETHESVPMNDLQGSQLDGQSAKEMAAMPESKESSEITDRTDREAVHPPRQYSNGYVPPPKVPWTTSTVIGLKAFWKWFLTPSGFLITLYGLNVVAWGGMLFLLLCNAAPAMCHPTCNDIQSPRRIWIEIDSQILNALFCVTGFGLAPWRFRDLYWWGWWRLGGSNHEQIGIRRLAGIHRNWFRLPGSEHLPEKATVATTSPEDPAVPIPHDKIPDPPPTGIHAPPTHGWKMDFVIWMNAWNTFFQVVLCFYMWHYDRYERPSWATGLFVALGCTVAGLGGIMMFHEGKYVKKVEGVPIPKGYEERPIDVEAQSPQHEPLMAVPGGAAKS